MYAMEKNEMKWMTFEEFCQNPPKPKHQTQINERNNSSNQKERDTKNCEKSVYTTSPTKV